MRRRHDIDLKRPSGEARRPDIIRKDQLVEWYRRESTQRATAPDARRREVAPKRPTGNPVKRMQDVALVVVVLLLAGVLSSNLLPVSQTAGPRHQAAGAP